MRDILIDEPTNKLPVNSFLLYGDTRTGKTEFGATLPRPLIIADVTEGGYKTVQRMDRSKWFEEDTKPIIKGIENMNDLAKLSPEVDSMIARGEVLSIVFDAFSFYCDFFLAQLIKLQAKPDNRAAYGSLGLHLREIRTGYHSKGVNTQWNCLAKHPDTDDPKGRPMIPGQQSDKFAAGCDFLMHSRVEQIKEGGKVVAEDYQLRTRQYGTYIVGNRLGKDANMLPDPFSGSYSDFITYLGYDVELIRKALPQRKIAIAVGTAQQRPAQPAAKPQVTMNNGGRVSPPMNRPAPKT
jgi:hypothetical protein